MFRLTIANAKESSAATAMDSFEEVLLIIQLFESVCIPTDDSIDGVKIEDSFNNIDILNTSKMFDC